MKRANTIKLATVLVAAIGMIIALSGEPANAKEEIMLAMVTKTDAMDEISSVYQERRAELTSARKETKYENFAEEMIQQVGEKIEETSSTEGWPIKLLRYVPYEIMTGDYGGLLRTRPHLRFVDDVGSLFKWRPPTPLQHPAISPRCRGCRPA